MAERTATLAMGARFELVLGGRDAARARAAGEAALAQIEQLDQRWSRFRNDSLIARVNRDAAREPVRVDFETFELLEACVQLRERTRGAFDIAARAGSTSDGPSYELDGVARTVRFTRADVALDLGAIGKGEALDRAREVLLECGVECALLHGGTSSVLALGAPPGESAWRVAVGARVFELCDESLSVSAPRGAAGERTPHVFDPRSGRGLDSTTRCVARSPSGRLAEAWSTAALVLAARGIDPLALAPAEVELSFDDFAAPAPSPTFACRT